MAAKKQQKNVLELLQGKFGKQSVGMYQDYNHDVTFLPTGSLVLDKALGGGIPLGRIIEIFGLESVGKTTIALAIMAQFQKYVSNNPGDILYINLEPDAFTSKWAENQSVDLSTLALMNPETGEDALNALDMAVSNGTKLVVFDSVAGLSPTSEQDGDAGDANMGLVARLMGQSLRKLSIKVKRSGCTIIFLNQVRDKMNTMAFGSKYMTPGGHALRFYSSIRMKVARKGSITDKGERIANQLVVTVIKNKVAPPFRECNPYIYFESGFDAYMDVIDLALKLKIFTAQGGWYTNTLTDVRIQGKGKWREYLMNPDCKGEFDTLYQKVWEDAVLADVTPDTTDIEGQNEESSETPVPKLRLKMKGASS